MKSSYVFLLAGWVGLTGLIVSLLGAYPAFPGAIGIGGALITIGSLLTMFATRNADEYTRSLWGSGASAAFASMVFLFLFLPFAEGVYDGITGDEKGRDIPAHAVTVAAMATFFIGYFFKRLRGGL